MNLRRSLIILMTIICLTVNIAGLLLYARHKTVKEAESWVSHSHEVIAQSQAFYGNTEKMIALQRGYMLSRQEEFLKDYRAVSNKLDKDINRLVALTKDNPGQNVKLIAVREKMDKLRPLLDQRIIDVTKNPVDFFKNDNDLQDVKVLADEVRDQTINFFNEEQRLLRLRMVANDKQETSYFYTLFAASAISILILIIANALIITISMKHKEVAADLTIAEQDLDKVRERLELAMKGTSDGIFDWNFKSGEIYFSQRFAEMLGYQESELPNSFDAFDKLLHPEAREQVWAHFNTYKNGDLPEYRNEIRMQHKDGSWRWHLVRATALQDEFGNRYRFVGAHTDITEAKIAEQRLIASNKELEDFTYIASHDLRSPLVNLKGFAGEIEYGLGIVSTFVHDALLQLKPAKADEIRDTIENEIPQSLNFITASVTKMEKLTRAILELSRVGRRQLRFEPLDIKLLVENCLKSLQHQITTKKVTVTVSDLPNTSGDAVAVEQVFGNLIDNALKYLDPDRTGEIEIGGIEGISENIYHVKDNGRGIRAEDLKKVFELFKRAGKHTDIPGEGMGLSYVQAILRRHGGAIWLESEIGRGTIFYFSIPHHLMKEKTDV